jgi:two-component sensor histidine kinase
VGWVRLDWFQAADRLLTLQWTEKGGPPVKAPTRRGFGGRVIERMIHDLKGKAHFEWRPEGIVCEIIVQA